MGATGKQGGAVARELLARGRRIPATTLETWARRQNWS